MYKKNLVTTIALATIIATAGCGKEEVVEALDTVQTVVESVEETAVETAEKADNSYTFESIDEKHHVKKFANGEEKTYEHFFNSDHKCIACGYEKEMTVSSMTYEEAMDNSDVVLSWSIAERIEYAKQLDHEQLDEIGWTERRRFANKYLSSLTNTELTEAQADEIRNSEETTNFWMDFIWTDEYSAASKKALDNWRKNLEAELSNTSGQSTGASDDIPAPIHTDGEFTGTVNKNPVPIVHTDTRLYGLS